MTSQTAPHFQDAFSYLTGTGEVVLLEEIAKEVEARLTAEGVEVDTPAVTAVLRGARLATEATARGELPPERGIYLDHVRGTLRVQRFILGDTLVEGILRALIAVLSQLDISRVVYTDP